MSVDTIMGKYRDQREPRRHRYDDEPVSFSERASEPSYFQRPAIGTADPADAEILWFNASTGFGFVKLSDGTEAYLHIRVLEAAGSRAVSEGTRLKVAVEESPRGHQVVQVLEISDQIAKTPADARLAEGSIAGKGGAQLEGEGTVKWYNPEKGFGFIAPDNGEKDVFVHATALNRSGLSVRVEGQKVFVECGQGKKGLEVRSIRLA
ncbi:cold-shock protein [Mesorhizobium delmotii]|uniref:Cold-shock DNA-binding domain-containing protein n=1 Tax=Mesorhizobium delmotii TaxID=1631247 RepID=A0A2P9AU28_9HYPH|nr:cold-shock protein [Mesorhizobium delmotii]SJM34666.1 Cold-shock DNA-binding domain-containing protein [Mesorhizobium delmotii]